MRLKRFSLFLSFILLFVMILTLVYPAVPQASLVGSGERIVREPDNGERLELRADQILVVDLEGNPSTGYLWEIVNFDIRVLHTMGAVEFVSQFDQLGAPVRMVYRFQVVGAGATDLVLVYRRLWEEQPPLDRFSIRVQTVGPFAPHSESETRRADDLSASATVPDQEEAGPASPEDLPTAFNWCDLGGCTPVKDQGYCGSC